MAPQTPQGGSARPGGAVPRLDTPQGGSARPGGAVPRLDAAQAAASVAAEA